MIRHQHIISFEQFAKVMRQISTMSTVSQAYFRKFGLTKVLRYAKVFFYDRRYSTSLIFSEEEYHDQKNLYQRLLNQLFSFINFNAQLRYNLSEYVYSFEMRLKSILSDLVIKSDAIEGNNTARHIDWTFGHLLKMVWNLKIDYFFKIMMELFGMERLPSINGLNLPTGKKELYAFSFVLFYFAAGISILRNNLSHNDLLYDFKRNKSMGRVFSYMKECYHWTKKDDRLNNDLWTRHLNMKNPRINIDTSFFRHSEKEKQAFLKYAKNFGSIKRILRDYFQIDFRDQNQGKLLGFFRIIDIFFFKDNLLLIFNRRAISPNFVLFSDHLLANGFNNSLEIRLEDFFNHDYSEFKNALFGCKENWSKEDQEIIKNMDTVFGILN